MNVKYAAKSGISSSLEMILGRRNLYRFARLLTYRARRDTMNNHAGENGEFEVQDAVLRHLRPNVIFDIGANVGVWSSRLLREHSNPDLRVYAFEPCAATFARLQQGAQDPRLKAIRCACSDSCGSAVINVVEEGSERNSLLEGLPGQKSTERIELVTIDAYCRDHEIGSIGLVKIDAEGLDLAVLRGAKNMLQAHSISFIQFEYNYPWIFSRSFLKDAFELLGGFGYAIGKLARGGIEFYPKWDWQLETFCQNNYVACLPSVKHIFHDFGSEWLRPGA